MEDAPKSNTVEGTLAETPRRKEIGGSFVVQAIRGDDAQRVEILKRLPEPVRRVVQQQFEDVKHDQEVLGKELAYVKALSFMGMSVAAVAWVVIKATGTLGMVTIGGATVPFLGAAVLAGAAVYVGISVYQKVLEYFNKRKVPAGAL